MRSISRTTHRAVITTTRAKSALSNAAVDEALWAAYSRYDRSQVTRYLIARFLAPRADVRRARMSSAVRH